MPVKTLPGLHELIAGDFNLTGQLRPVEVEDLLGREPVDTDLDVDRRVPRGRGGARHRRRRFHRRRALPPDRPHGPDPARPRGQRRARPVRDRAGARRRAWIPCDCGRARRRRERDEDAPALREVPARRGLPRCGLQARGARRGEPDRGRAQQHARHPHGGRSRGRVRREALRPHLHGQGRERQGRDGQHEGALRVDRRGVGAPRRHVDAVLRRSLRERAGFVGQRHPDLPAPDRSEADRSPSPIRR